MCMTCCSDCKCQWLSLTLNPLMPEVPTPAQTRKATYRFICSPPTARWRFQRGQLPVYIFYSATNWNYESSPNKQRAVTGNVKMPVPRFISCWNLIFLPGLCATSILPPSKTHWTVPLENAARLKNITVLVEVQIEMQAVKHLKATSLGSYPIIVQGHWCLNPSRGVNTTDSLDGMSH
jgi:hypothetical protein